MSYHLIPQRRLAARYRRPRPAMGGFFDVIADLNVFNIGKDLDPRTAECNATADQHAAPVDAQVTELDQTWNPTGFYTVDEMTTVMKAAFEFMRVPLEEFNFARLQGIASPLNVEAAEKAMDAFNRQRTAANPFTTALDNAHKQNIAVIDAPGLKFWVIGLLKASVNLSRAGSFIACNTPLSLKMFRKLADAVASFVEIIKKIVGVILKVGELALEVVGDAGALLAKLIKYGPMLLLLGGGAFLFYKLKKARRESSL